MCIEKYEEKLKFVNDQSAAIEAELEAYADKFLQEHFNRTLDIPIKLNGRLTRSLGRFVSNTLGESLRIEISKDLCTDALLTEDNSRLYGVIKHECIHYALFEQGLPSNDDDIEFINSCYKAGAPLTGIIDIKQREHHYICAAGHEHFRTRKVNLERQSCGCGEELEYLGRIVR